MSEAIKDMEFLERTSPKKYFEWIGYSDCPNKFISEAGLIYSIEIKRVST